MGLVALAVSYYGLWRKKAWAWALAVLTEGVFCAQILFFLLQAAGSLKAMTLRSVVFMASDFVGLWLLLHHPVRKYFLQTTGRTPLVGAVRVSLLSRALRVLAYFAVAVSVCCAVTAFSLSLVVGSKLGGPRGFLVLFCFGFQIGALASLTFVGLLTLAARHLGPATGWVWLAGGGLIAAALERLFLLPIDFFQVHEVAGVSYLLGGPAYLRNMWWLVIPSGIVTAMICYELYPWSFQRSR